MAPDQTGATGVSGIDQMHWHACPCGFVDEELTELIESPRMPLIAMFATNRDSLTNPTQIFESACLARDGGSFHQDLAYTVMHIALETPFLARVLAQAGLGVPDIDLLKALAAVMMARANDVNLCA